MIAVLQPAGGILADGLQMGGRVGREADIDVGWRHGQRLQPADFPGIAQKVAGGRDEGEALAATLAPHRQRLRADDHEAFFLGEPGDGRTLRHRQENAAPGRALRDNPRGFIGLATWKRSRRCVVDGECMNAAGMIKEALLEGTTEAERFRLLVEAVTDYAIYMLDLDGIVTSWNAGAERIKGYKANEIVGRNFANFYEEADRKAGIPQRVLAIAARDGKFQAEGWRVRKDGSRFWAFVIIDAIYDNGELIGFAKITRDLTERREAEEELRRSEELFRRLVEGVTDYAIYMLDPSGIVSNWNAGAQRIKGYEPDEIVGQHFSIFYTDEDRSRGEPARSLATAEREGRFEAEAWRAAQGRHPLLGQCRDRRHPRSVRPAGGFCQDHARHHRAPRSTARPRPHARGAGALAEDRGDRQADRRRGARLQQSADRRAGQPRSVAALSAQ